MAGAGEDKHWDHPDSEPLDRTWECVAALYQIRVLGRGRGGGRGGGEDRTSQASVRWREVKARLRIFCKNLKCFPGYFLPNTFLFKWSSPKFDASLSLPDSHLWGCRNLSLHSLFSLSGWNQALQFKWVLLKSWTRNFWPSEYFIELSKQLLWNWLSHAYL